jgi:hypothetical protein
LILSALFCGAQVAGLAIGFIRVVRSDKPDYVPTSVIVTAAIAIAASVVAQEPESRTWRALMFIALAITIVGAAELGAFMVQTFF